MDDFLFWAVMIIALMVFPSKNFKLVPVLTSFVFSVFDDIMNYWTISSKTNLKCLVIRQTTIWVKANIFLFPFLVQCLVASFVKMTLFYWYGTTHSQIDIYSRTHRLIFVAMMRILWPLLEQYILINAQQTANAVLISSGTFCSHFSKSCPL